MSDLTVEEQMARYGEATERRALEAPLLALASHHDRPSNSRWVVPAAAVLLLLAVGAGTVGLLGRASPPTDHQVARAAQVAYVDSVLGWTVEVPAGWFVREFDEPCWRGFAVLNTDRDLLATSADCSVAIQRWAYEADHAAVVVYEFTGRGGLIRVPSSEPRVDTAYPVSFSDELGPQWMRIVADGEETGLTIAQYLGFGAAVWDLDAVESVVASLRPPILP